MDNNQVHESEIFPNHKLVYGPVKSWRLGQSLGIDPIFETSTCSFNCIYCQLGEIQVVTTKQSQFVPTAKIVEDFSEIYNSGEKIDVITYSGSGEPTLATNIDEMISEIRKIAPEIKQMILTNATELHREEVRKRILGLDKIIVKIDASDEHTFKLINRPAEGVTLEKCIEGILKLKKEYKGEIEVQSMFLPLNNKNIEDFTAIINKVDPDVLQLNTPKRPYPLSWHRENRGNHLKIFNYEVRELKTITREMAAELEAELAKKISCKILSIY